MTNFKLYHYWRSSSSWRVRMMLAHKKIQYSPVAINLLNDDTETPEYRKLSPAGTVPVLEWEQGEKIYRLTESLAIAKFLDETIPNAPLLPVDPYLAARTWALAETINAATQPLQNLPVLEKIGEKKIEWAQHFIRLGLSTYIELSKDLSGIYSVGDALTLADMCLIPQLYNAVRFQIDIQSEFPELVKIQSEVSKTDEYKQSHPDQFVVS